MSKEITFPRKVKSKSINDEINSIKKSKNMVQKRLIITGIALIIALMAVSYVSSYQLLCLTDGDKLPPNMNPPRYKCEHDVCQICVTNNLYPTDLKLCKDIQNCNQFNSNSSNGGIDIVPPVLTIISPVNNKVYGQRGVLFQLSADESSTFYYKDNTKPTASWVKLSSLAKTFSKSLSLKEGLNDLTIRAVDARGNPTNTAIKFYIDSVAPKITKTLPIKGFTDGNFQVLFSAGAPKTVLLNYGNSAVGMRNANVDLTQCTVSSGKHNCNISVNLADFNNQAISYSFKVTNSADISVNSKVSSLNVDNSAPVIKNADSMLNINGKYVYFNISVNELNFDSASFYDYSAPRPKWTKLCTTLKNSLCTKKITFLSGTHNIDIKVIDKAGNSLIQSKSFTI